MPPAEFPLEKFGKRKWALANSWCEGDPYFLFRTFLRLPQAVQLLYAHRDLCAPSFYERGTGTKNRLQAGIIELTSGVSSGPMDCKAVLAAYAPRQLRGSYA